MFKRAQVVMLSTEKASNIVLGEESLKLHFRDNTELWGYNHLYILSDEEIIEGDWVYDRLAEDFNCSDYYKANLKIADMSKTTNRWGKIIATTDKSLQIPYVSPENEGLDIYEYSILPEPSLGFIEAYIEAHNSGNSIVEVDVEYIEKTTWFGDKTNSWHSIKVNPKDNTIAIRKIKDGWNREEIIELIKAFSDYKRRPFTSEDISWIKQNL